ncbi:HNH endonuclease [Larkinella soli]|uniref:HNH endonuclease n=1 Tax=Larkinella soli TaxID=1770527 RepID=UPI000FFBC665|nr:HNH endonuclease [Larkinella soli]
MNWKLILKKAENQPKTGTYSDWKEQIAEECFHRCVYCSIPESQFGGINNYHIDHYRPKSLPEFIHLENDILNLFYACPICNRFKSNDWPNDSDDLELVCYPDPSKIDYSHLFKMDDNFLLHGNVVAARYLVERLFLNRAQLVYERKELTLIKKAALLIDEIMKIIGRIEDKELLLEAFVLIGELHNTLAEKAEVRPYELFEIRRP